MSAFGVVADQLVDVADWSFRFLRHTPLAHGVWHGRQLTHQAPCDGDGMSIIVRNVVGHAAGAAVHLGTAQTLCVDDFAGRSLDQLWPAQEHVPLAPYDDNFVAQLGI